MHVEPARPSDLAAIQAAYDDGARLQRERGADEWPAFSDRFVLDGIAEGRVYRVTDGPALFGVFTVAYADAEIWGGRERGRHLYLHQISRAAGYPGRGLVPAVVAWARAHARSRGLDGLRLDTWTSNAALTTYYERAGFTVVGRTYLPEDAPLPPHYRGIDVVLMEMPL